jgi:hypothetical protein
MLCFAGENVDHRKIAQKTGIVQGSILPRMQYRILEEKAMRIDEISYLVPAREKILTS